MEVLIWSPDSGRRTWGSQDRDEITLFLDSPLQRSLTFDSGSGQGWVGVCTSTLGDKGIPMTESPTVPEVGVFSWTSKTPLQDRG